MLYRIFTEKKRVRKIRKIISKYYEGFTLIFSQGFWKGIQEKSLIIELVIDEADDVINKLANDIKIINGQDVVLIQKIQNNHWMV